MACTNRKKNISNKTKQHVIHLYYICHHKQEDIAADLRIGLPRSKFQVALAFYTTMSMRYWWSDDAVSNKGKHKMSIKKLQKPL